jgi:hypothetical protein
MTRKLKRRAYLEAAELLACGMDAYDLPPDLSEEDESTVREFIRIQIVAELRKRADPR